MFVTRLQFFWNRNWLLTISIASHQPSSAVSMMHTERSPVPFAVRCSCSYPSYYVSSIKPDKRSRIWNSFRKPFKHNERSSPHTVVCLTLVDFTCRECKLSSWNTIALNVPDPVWRKIIGNKHRFTYRVSLLFFTLLPLFFFGFFRSFLRLFQKF